MFDLHTTTATGLMSYFRYKYIARGTLCGWRISGSDHASGDDVRCVQGKGTHP